MKFALSMIAGLLAGCAATVPRPHDAGRGDVFYDAIDVDTDDRYRLAGQQDFRLGGVLADTRVVPAYPAAWEARAPREVFICTELHVDEQGAVFGTRAVHAARCGAAGEAWDADFRAEVDRAVRRWRFEPSYQCTLPDGAQADGECRDAETLEAVPVSRAFRFAFRWTQRGGVVEGGETPP